MISGLFPGFNITTGVQRKDFLSLSNRSAANFKYAEYYTIPTFLLLPFPKTKTGTLGSR
jgi:hypothetical protein